MFHGNDRPIQLRVEGFYGDVNGSAEFAVRRNGILILRGIVLYAGGRSGVSSRRGFLFLI